MIVYNVTFHIDREVLAQALVFLKQEYLTNIAACGYLSAPHLRRIHTDPAQNEGESYAIQFTADNLSTLNRWLADRGEAIHQKLTARFGYQIAGFATLMDEIDWEKG